MRDVPVQLLLHVLLAPQALALRPTRAPPALRIVHRPAVHVLTTPQEAPPTARDAALTSTAPLRAALDGESQKSRMQREGAAIVARALNGGGGGGIGDERPPTSGATEAAGAAGVGTRATAVLPSGAGKTVFALRVAEAVRPRLTLVLVPSIDLVSQSYREWERWREGPALARWRALAVVSSSSVPESVLPRTTSNTTIARWLHDVSGADGAAGVIFCTYHSAARVSEALALEGGGRALDLLVCDEAHRCTGRLSKRDAQPLNDDFLRASRRLFLTATPKLLGSRRDGEGALVPAGSMDDEELFGRVAYRLGYAEAVERGLVAPLKLVLLNISDAYARLVANGPSAQLIAVANDTAATRDLAELSAALVDCHEQYGARTAFAFCSTNRRAADLERAAEAALASRGIGLSRVSGEMGAAARAAALEPVRRASQAAEAAAEGGAAMCVVTNCRVLAEGIDVPAVDLVVFADAKHSHTDVLQCMGRASRLAPGKEYGHVLVPVPEGAAEESGSFATALSVVRAYAEQDEEFREALGSLVEEQARVGRPLARDEWPEAVRRVVELPGDGLSVRRMVGEQMVATVARALVDRWEWMYGLLRAFREREGHVRVPNDHVVAEGGEALGGWLSKQRQMHRSGRLVPTRARRLEALGVVWDVLADQWERSYTLLRAFHEREGHAIVPYAHVEEGERLGQWLQNQRKRYRARGWSEEERRAKRLIAPLSDEEVGRLEALGVVWRLR